MREDHVKSRRPHFLLFFWPPFRYPERAILQPKKTAMIREFSVRTGSRDALVNITGRVEEAVREAGVEAGLCVVAVPHTTAGITVNENADPSVRRDLLMTLARMVPDSLPYTHAEGNSPAHVKASLVGSSAVVLIADGQLRLGTWQGIFLCEFDGPRERRVWVRALQA